MYRLIIFFCLLIPDFLFAQEDLNNAGSYLSFIGTQYEETAKNMMSYTSAVAHGKSARKVDKRRSELLQQIKESERNIRKMKPFQNDSKLRDSVAAYFRICQIVLNEDYGKIVNLEDIAEQSYDAMEAYLLAKEKADQKLDDASDRASDQYDAFAAANNIKLVKNDSKLSQKMKAAGKVNEYYNKLYLIFFKSYKNEVYFLDAMAKNDVGSMEQTKNALLNGVETDMPKLGPITAYEGDNSLKNACQQLLTFYKKEATTQFPVMVEFLLNKENYEKMKKAFDAKGSKRTEQDIDAYNKVVNDFNAWVNKANTVNNECNKNRATYLNNWNSSTEKFLDGHTPKYK